MGFFIIILRTLFYFENWGGFCICQQQYAGGSHKNSLSFDIIQMFYFHLPKTDYESTTK